MKTLIACAMVLFLSACANTHIVRTVDVVKGPDGKVQSIIEREVITQDMKCRVMETQWTVVKEIVDDKPGVANPSR